MERVDELVEKECICRDCSTYVAEESRIGFCYFGASEVIKEEKGCLCPLCRVAAVMELKGEFYCTKEEV